MEGESLLHRLRSSGRDQAGWTNHFLVQVLHPSPVQSSRSFLHMQTVLLPKQIIYTLRFNLQIQVKRKENNLQHLNERKKIKKRIQMQDQSLLHRSRSSGRDFAGWTNPFLGQYLHPYPVQRSRSIQCTQTVLVAKQILYDTLT